MSREGDFSKKTKKAAVVRQGGVCAFCGIKIKTPWTEGEYQGNAHHLRPLTHGGLDNIDNCVYLCWDHHQLIGHGMAPYGIDKQGGGSNTWVQMEPEDFEFWNVDFVIDS